MAIDEELAIRLEVFISDQVFRHLEELEELLSGWRCLLRFQTRCLFKARSLFESGHYLRKCSMYCTMLHVLLCTAVLQCFVLHFTC